MVGIIGFKVVVMTAVVVGAGFSGVIAARELVRAGWQVVLIDPGARPGRGLAYGTTAPWHLLNSPASAMSIDPDDPGHFARWAGVDPGAFVPRSRYGDYLSEALRSVDGLGSLTVHRGRVARIFEASGGGLTVLLADDVVIPAAKVVLAVGNQAPAQPFPVSPGVSGYVRDPWAADALSDLPEGPVLLVGTGLTAVDVALSLAANGHTDITAVSRHGLLPQSHAGSTPSASFPVAASPHTAIAPPPVNAFPTVAPHSALPHAALPLPTGGPLDGRGLSAAPSGGRVTEQTVTLAGVMREIRVAAAKTGDWRSVMDGLRPHWNELWQRLSPADQQRFLRHVARYWEVHRHRMAPAVASSLNGVLNVQKAEVCGITEDGVIMRRTGGIETRRYSVVVNCTGPGPVTTHPLVRALIADGLAQPGPYGLGLATDEHGALAGRSPRRGQIYTLGPARRGVLWETTAVPEIRAQARALATHLLPVGRPMDGALGWSRADSAYPLPG
jgi:uncharacterized NAD(P)/FAD-binding protein YdhS